MLESTDGSTQSYDGSSLIKITVPTRTYSLSKKGKESIAMNERMSFISGSKQVFCVATYKVNEITSFSEPSQSMGYTVSNVNFSISPENIKVWANNKYIMKAFPQLSKALRDNQKHSATLVLMNNGWMYKTTKK